jgi:transposase
MLQELSVVEQRYLAVREVLDGAKVTDVATRYGVDRRTVHRRLVRYANEALGALADRSSRPNGCPHQIAPEIEARIVALRREHPSWGPRTILSKLRRELEHPPSRSSIYRCLVRHRLIDRSAEIEAEDLPRRAAHTVGRRVDPAGRISILKHRYHVGRHLAGQRVFVESVDGLLHVTHDGVLVATHARRHLAEDDDRMDRRAKASRPAPATTGGEVLRKVDPSGSVSFAGAGYRVGNRYIGQIVGVRVVADTVQIAQDALLLRTHRARHDKTKEFGALANPGGRPRKRTVDVA